MQEDTHTKWWQEYEVGNGTKYGLEDQLQWLIKAITDSSTAITAEIHESNHVEFGMVSTKLESIFDLISKKSSAQPLLQDSPSINTKPRVWNVQVPSTAIDARKVEGSVEAWKFVGNNRKGFSPVNVPN